MSQEFNPIALRGVYKQASHSSRIWPTFGKIGGMSVIWLQYVYY